MKEKTKAMVIASFAADALALGAHWIYDTTVIEKTFGRVADLQAPGANSFHAGKGKGDFTHYGDQMLALLRSVALRNGFSPDGFAEDWRALFADYTGYRDHATRQTLENFHSGQGGADAGSRSTDLGGASRIAPLGHVYRDDPRAFAEAARIQTALTHNVPEVIDSAEFFARVAAYVLAGHDPVAAISRVRADGFDRPPFDGWIGAGLESVSRNSTAAIAGFGQMCNAAAAFPSVIHLIVKYSKDLGAALVENTMAGGDSAARGMMVGMVLGAHLGEDAIPGRWLKEMTAYDEISGLLS
ncbi:MAG: ADP-ribosylglycohydrolase family protein [Desulfobacterales bacterium]|nr:ADP-ribosylglycohydrolase family protein [Desulfobacterales bacterium]